MEPQKIVDQVNVVRAEHGAAPLSVNVSLKTAADKKTREMQVNNYFSHQNDEGETVTSLVPAEYKYYTIGENLAFGFRSENELVDAWMKSPTHKANLLDSEYRDTAVSVRQVNGKTLVAQVFGVQQQEYLSSKTAASIFGDIPIAEVTFYVSTALFIVVLLWMTLGRRRK